MKRSKLMDWIINGEGEKIPFKLLYFKCKDDRDVYNLTPCLLWIMCRHTIPPK